MYENDPRKQQPHALTHITRLSIPTTVTTKNTKSSQTKNAPLSPAPTASAVSRQNVKETESNGMSTAETTTGLSA